MLIPRGWRGQCGLMGTGDLGLGIGDGRREAHQGYFCVS
jgi:hypothetical protein